MKVNNFIKKINDLKSRDSFDISAWEDLSIGLMNLVSLEEHSFFSYIKTKDESFLTVLNTCRDLRKKLLKLIIVDDDGSEKWCMSKHLLASSMRLYEVGNRLLGEGKESDAKAMYDDAAELYGLFWKLNTHDKESKKRVISQSPVIDKKEGGVFDSIKKFLECCKE
jgi:hypothetical protein